MEPIVATELYTQDHLAQVLGGLIELDADLVNLTHKDVGIQGRGDGGRVTFRRPGAVVTSSRAIGSTANYDLAEVKETTATAELEFEAYSLVPLSLTQQDLDLNSFATQIGNTQASSISAFIEQKVADLLSAVPAEAGLSTTDGIYAAVVNAQKVLRLRGINSEAVAVVSPDVYAEAQLELRGNAPILVDGRVAGVKLQSNNRVAAGTFTIFVSQAVVTILRAPSVPAEAAHAGQSGAKGCPVTTVRTYNGANGVVTSYAGTLGTVLENKLVRADHETGTVTEVSGLLSIATA